VGRGKTFGSVVRGKRGGKREPKKHPFTREGKRRKSSFDVFRGVQGRR